MAGVGIHWFRHSLRLHDNQGLVHASQNATNLIPLYILDPKDMHPNEMGANRLAFLLESLSALDAELKNLASRLIVVKGEPIDVMKSFISTFNVKVLTMENCIQQEMKVTDEDIASYAKSQQVDVHTFFSYTIFDPKDLIKSNEGKCPLTITELLLLIADVDDMPSPLPAPKSLPPPPPILDVNYEGIQIYNQVPTFLDYKDSQYAGGKSEIQFMAGEKFALEEMQSFLGQQMNVDAFEKFKLRRATSVVEVVESPVSTLSPYLANGSLSAGVFYALLKETLRESIMTSAQPPLALHEEIFFREFAYLISYDTPNFDNQARNPLCAQIPWLKEEKAKPLADLWEFGRTGYPSVDAAMNQLRMEGWMDHRARQLVAYFLTRGALWVSWELGRDIFKKYLVDHDWSINNFNWLIICGCCPQLSTSDYLREFHPVTWLQRTDPNGLYIRAHIPALQGFPEEYIYEPWKAPQSVQKEAGCIICVDYPGPIVDYEKSSRENMDKIKRFVGN